MKKFLIFLIFIFISPNSLKAETVTGAELKKTIESWLAEKGISSNIDILDQIKYPKCPISNFIINDISGNNKLIKVSCIAPYKWDFIVRNKVNTKKSAKENRHGNKINVLALKYPKKTGAIVTKDDLITIQKNISNTDGLIETEGEIVGRKLKRSIQANRALYYSNVEKNWLIEKNSVVLIENKHNNITIKAEGIALENADYMDKIRVKNIKSGKILHGFAENRKKIVLNAKQY